MILRSVFDSETITYKRNAKIKPRNKTENPNFSNVRTVNSVTPAFVSVSGPSRMQD